MENDRCVARSVFSAGSNDVVNTIDLLFEQNKAEPFAGQAKTFARQENGALQDQISGIERYQVQGISTTAILDSQRYMLNETFKGNTNLPSVELVKVGADDKNEIVAHESSEYSKVMEKLAPIAKSFQSLPDCKINRK